MTSSGARVRLRSVSKRFRTSGVAVDSVDLDIAEGEFVTLLGPSGSGKTTTLNMIAGFVEPDEGEIELDGVNIAHTPVHKRGIGMVFQHFSLFPHMTVGGNIGFPLKQRGMSREEISRRVDEVLQTVNLSGYAERRPHELSGGQQQRVAIARSIVFGPRLLLMDEPLSALDKKLREHLQLEIKRIQRVLGVTCIFVTHDQEEALLLSDRIVVFNEGGVAQVGTPQEVYSRPTKRFVAEFLGDSNILDGVLGTEADGTRYLECEEGRFKMETRAHDGVASVLVRPESIELAPARDASADGVLCEVVDIDYFGAVTKCWLRSRSGRVFHVRYADPDAAALAPGDAVAIRWSPERAHVLEA